MNSTFKRNLFISSGVSIVILVVSSIASYLSISSLVKSNRLVNHTHDIIYNLNTASMIMVDAQTGMRGFLVTGKDEFLKRYVNAETESDSYIEKIRKLILNSSKIWKN
jgi:CHASE3 domain sensor protein